MSQDKPQSKFNIPVAIVLSSIIIAISLYAVQQNKQSSIERQQLLQLQMEKEALEKKAEIEQKESDDKIELQKKEYISKKKNDCLDIYKTESDKWNNVLGWRYGETEDKCFIRYRDQSPKTDAQCDEDWPTEGLALLRQNSLCKEGEFENIF